MHVPTQSAWKLVLALLLVCAMLLSQFSRAPSRSVPGHELRRLVIAAIALYAVGAVASLTHHQLLAALLYAAGISTCTLAAWLSRGRDSEDPPDDEEPSEEQPPPSPDGLPEFDWERFEAAFRADCEQRRSSGVI